MVDSGVMKSAMEAPFMLKEARDAGGSAVKTCCTWRQMFDETATAELASKKQVDGRVKRTFYVCRRFSAWRRCVLPKRTCWLSRGHGGKAGVDEAAPCRAAMIVVSRRRS